MFRHKFTAFSIMIAVMLLISGSASASSGEERIKEILPAFEKYAQDSMKELKVPGMAIGIVSGDKLVYAEGFGVRKLGGTDPVTPDTIFQIGSCSKAFGSALLAIQVDQGRLSWDDKVIDRLPEFRMYDPWVTGEFTITDMLCHRSGLPHHFGDLMMEMDYNRSQLTNALRYEKPVTSFRSAYAYQNLEYVVAQNLTEKLTGKAWSEAVKEDIFLPLGMENSSADLQSFKKGSNVAYLHQVVNGTLEPIPMNWKYLDWTYNVGPSGAINTNINDMAKWLIMLMNNGTYNGKQIISQDNVRYMLAPKTVLTNPAMKAAYNPMPFDYYCFGWRYGEYSPGPIIWHTGGTSGHLTIIAFEPQAKVGIMIFANRFDPVPTMLAKKFMDMYFDNPSQDYLDQRLKEEAVAESSDSDSQTASQSRSPAPLPYDSYAGNYTNEIYGNLRVFVDNGSLAMVLGPRNTEVILKPSSRDMFIMYLPDFPDYSGFAPATFRIGPDGKADELITEGGLFDGSFKKI